MSTVPLSALAVGQKARIASLDLPHSQRLRLLEIGLTVGTEFEVVRFAPLGDPVDIKVRGYHLSIRKQEASGIHVTLP